MPGNEGDNRLFSHQMPRPLTAHQMADALAQATDVPNVFAGTQNAGKRAIQIQDPATGSIILETFGRCSRINGCASVANPSLSLRQSLLVIGGNVIEEKVANLRGYLANLLELSPGPDEIVENLYLRTLCRMPTSEESAHWTAELSQAKNSARRPRICSGSAELAGIRVQSLTYFAPIPSALITEDKPWPRRSPTPRDPAEARAVAPCSAPVY